MQVSNAIPINRIELESQILCVALRQSLIHQDKEGVSTSIRELTNLFPDLLPHSVETTEPEENINYYHVLKLQPQSGLDKILTGYLQHVRNFLKKNNAKTESQAFNKILNAGLVLRKPRLRLSHDLALAKYWLSESDKMPDEAKANLETSTQQSLAKKQSTVDQKTTKTKDEMTQLSEQQESIILSTLDNEDSTSAKPLLELPTAQGTKREETKTKDHETTKPQLSTKTNLPDIIQLMEAASLITELEKQALETQIKLAPKVSLEQLLLNNGYITHNEFISLQLAQSLLAKGAISMAQFEVAMFDEHTTGLRMAESLQIRGWLPT